MNKKKELIDKFKPVNEILGKRNSQIEMLETDTLFPYSEYPFFVKDNEDLKELVQSIKDEGVLIPLLVRGSPDNEREF